MNVVTTLEEVVSESPDFLRVATDLAGAVPFMEKKDIIGLYTYLKAHEADFVKTYSDIKALGAQQGA